jgi:isopenicillin N synthase-like dioxygenase
MDASRKLHFFVSACDAHCVFRILGSFLWADPTRDALQVFLQRQFPAIENPSTVTLQDGVEEGIWVNVDPIPGCIVCNIGESQWVTNHALVSASKSLYHDLVWEVWTNGLYKSTIHRVIHRGSNYR